MCVRKPNQTPLVGGSRIAFLTNIFWIFPKVELQTSRYFEKSKRFGFFNSNSFGYIQKIWNCSFGRNQAFFRLRTCQKLFSCTGSVRYIFTFFTPFSGRPSRFLGAQGTTKNVWSTSARVGQAHVRLVLRLLFSRLPGIRSLR